MCRESFQGCKRNGQHVIHSGEEREDTWPYVLVAPYRSTVMLHWRPESYPVKALEPIRLWLDSSYPTKLTRGFKSDGIEAENVFCIPLLCRNKLVPDRRNVQTYQSLRHRQGRSCGERRQWFHRMAKCPHPIVHKDRLEDMQVMDLMVEIIDEMWSMSWE